MKQPHFTKDYRTRAIHVKLPVHIKEALDDVTLNSPYISKTGIITALLQCWLDARETGQKIFKLP